MKIDLQLNSGMTLKIDTNPVVGMTYPTARIQKGLILSHEGKELCEEGVGFGVPILKIGLRTIFPGAVELFPLEGSFTRGMHARFLMNLEEKIIKSGSGTINNPILYEIKNILAALIRRLPSMRPVLTRSSNLLRSRFGWETIYEPANFSTDLCLTYLVAAENGRIKVALGEQETIPKEVTEVILMNEQGANCFDQYQDTDGNCAYGDEIGCWDQVTAAAGSFINSKHQISFSLAQVNGASLYRGRERIGKRLAWSGFGYSFPPTLDHISYTIEVKRLA